MRVSPRKGSLGSCEADPRRQKVAVSLWGPFDIYICDGDGEPEDPTKHRAVALSTRVSGGDAGRFTPSQVVWRFGSCGLFPYPNSVVNLCLHGFVLFWLLATKDLKPPMKCGFKN